MKSNILFNRFFPLFIFSFLVSSCASYHGNMSDRYGSGYLSSPPSTYGSYSSRIPSQISSTEKTVVVDPRVHVWGAYQNGTLVKAGIASAGSNWCNDLGRPCHTHVGTFRIYSLGSPGCKSHIFPMPHGGAPMPYCMFFSSGQALHGVPDSEVGEGNFSHGCVRMHVGDAEWLRYNFVNIGTKVVIKPY